MDRIKQHRNTNCAHFFFGYFSKSTEIVVYIFRQWPMQPAWHLCNATLDPTAKSNTFY